MKKFDLRKIHRALEFGDITKVENAVGVKPGVVTKCLLRGWHPDKRNEIVAAALDVIRAKGENPELVKEAEAMNFTTDSFMSVNRPVRNKFRKGNKYGGKSKEKPGGVWKVIAGLGVAVFALWFLVGKNLFAKKV